MVQLFGPPPADAMLVFGSPVFERMNQFSRSREDTWRYHDGMPVAHMQARLGGDEMKVAAVGSAGPVLRSSGASARPGILLDRDGTIIVDHGYVGSIDRVEFIEGAAEAIASVQRGQHSRRGGNQPGGSREGPVRNR